MRRAVIFGASLWVALAAAPAVSEEKHLPVACLEQRTASIHLNFNNSGTDARALREKLNADIREIQSLSAGIGVTKMNAGGINYSINAQPQVNGEFQCLDCMERRSSWREDSGNGDKSNITYQLFGNVNFIMEPESKSLELLGLLQKKNYPATLSYVDVNKTAGSCRLNVATGEWE